MLDTPAATGSRSPVLLRSPPFVSACTPPARRAEHEPVAALGFSLSEAPDSALPRATGTLTLNGNGAAIERASEAPDFRLLYVTSTANVTLNGVTLRRGSAAIDGGGIYNEGTLTVNGMTGNSAVTAAPSTAASPSRHRGSAAFRAYRVRRTITRPAAARYPQRAICADGRD